MNRINIDFETFSKVDLKAVGAHRYAMDKSTEVLCLSYALNDEEPSIWVQGEPMPQDLFDMIAKGYLVYAWNTTFEYVIWRYICVERMGWPEIPLEQWRDTQAIALNFAWPMALGKCGEAMNLDIQKDKRGDQLIKWLCVPQKPSKKHPHVRRTREHYPDLFEELYSYCKDDVKAEREILKQFPWELSEQELVLWRYTLLKNNRGIPIDTELVDKVVDVLEEYIDEVCQIVPIITSGAVTTIGQRQKILDWCEINGYELPNLTAETVADALEDPEIENFPAVKSLLEIRQLAGKSSVKKFPKMQAAVCLDGRIRDCLKYHKATTGREGGRLLQPQNLPRAEVDEDPVVPAPVKSEFTDKKNFSLAIDQHKELCTENAIQAFKNKELDELMGDYSDILYTASALIRPSICATKGKKLIVSDYSQIENRGVFWLAGQLDALEKIESGVDLYRDMASDLYEIPYEDIPKDSPKRRHGKLTMLGCGYGMGWETFQKDCIIKQKFPMSEFEAKRTIKIFRDKYSDVVDLWYGLQDAAIEATINQGNITSYSYIQFMHVHGYLFMILPNGKSLAYPEARVEEREAPWGGMTTNVTHAGKNPHTKKWGRNALTPGRLAENATQAMCREILMEAVVDLEELEAAKDSIILTVHDEVVLEVGTDDLYLEEVNKILCDRGPIYEGLPLKAAGFETVRYHK